MSILKDAIRPLGPSSLQEFLEPDREVEAGQVNPGTSPETEGTSLTDDLPPHLPMGRTSFELASRGGYVRTVTGTVVYLDEDAETYMVLRGNGDGGLLRVPLRDITSAHETAMSGLPDSGPVPAGLGTGQ